LSPSPEARPHGPPHPMGKLSRPACPELKESGKYQLSYLYYYRFIAVSMSSGGDKSL
jgi:hypothetical protein